MFHHLTFQSSNRLGCDFLDAAPCSNSDGHIYTSHHPCSALMKKARPYKMLLLDHLDSNVLDAVV